MQQLLQDLFIFLLNMSITASYVIALILVARLLLKKAPKIFSYALWGVVLIRLVCPFSLERTFSLLPATTSPISQNSIYQSDLLNQQNQQLNSGISIVDNRVNTSFSIPGIEASANPLQVILFILSILWLLGAFILLVYSFVSYLIVKRIISTAVRIKGQIFECESISSPFVLGLINPKIYLPIGLSKNESRYILMHEQVHIHRLDHMIKLLAFLTLCVYWFNPLVWIAFVLMSKDMEMSCDEAVLKAMGSEIKVDYSNTLLFLATGGIILRGNPLAFGESNVKSRIKNVLNYKKPSFWVVGLSIIIAALVSIGLMTNPSANELAPEGALKTDAVQAPSPIITSTFESQPADETQSEIQPEIQPEVMHSQVTTDLELSISNAILSASTSGMSGYVVAGEGHITLQTVEKDGVIYAHILERYSELGFENDILTEISGHGNPSLLSFQKDSAGNYILVEHIRAFTDEIDARVQEIFPESAVKRFTSAEHEKIKLELDSQIEAYGEAYLQKIGSKADVQISLER